MKRRKLAQRILPVVGMVTLASGCASNSDLYAKYDDICELPKPEVVERVKLVEKVKVKVVEKVKPVETIKVVEKVKPVETIKYIDRVKVVEKVKVVHKPQYIKQGVPGVLWEPAVYFGFDLASLDKSEQARLDRDLLVLKQHANLKLSIQAFTDSKGSNRYNRRLALQRQQTVLNYLMSKGLQRDRVLVSPLGEELPILGNSKTERVINRRVELMLLDATGRPLSLSIQPKASTFKAPFPVK